MNNKIRVCIIGYVPTPYRVPFYNLLVKKYNKYNFKVFFFTKLEPSRLWDLDKYRFEFEYECLKGMAIKYRKKDGDLCILYINFSLFKKLFAFRSDIIVSTGHNSLTSAFALFYAKIFRTPFVLWFEQTLLSEPKKKFLGRFVRGLAKKIFINFSDAYIVPGSLAKEYLVRNGARDDRIFISPYAIDLEYFTNQVKESALKKEEVKRCLKLNSENKCIVFAGQLIWRKGVFTLLDAYNLLSVEEKKKTYLLLLGSGMLEEQIKQYCRENNLENVLMPGYKQQDELIKYFDISDIFVLPSRYDTWGMVVNEAMACGLPVIVTKGVGASGDIVVNGVNGYIVNVDNPQELYLAIKKMLDDEELTAKMSKKSIEIISSWTLDRAVRGFDDAIMRIIHEKSNIANNSRYDYLKTEINKN